MPLITRLSTGLAVCVLVACAGNPPSEVSPSPETSPTASPGLSPTVPASPPASPDPRPTESPDPSPAGPTPTPAERPTPSFSPSQPPAAWDGPSQISERLYDEPSLVVDGAGVPQIAARLEGGIFHVTNASGSWTRERVSRAPRRNSDGQPSIAVDRDGTLWIAFTRLLDTELGRFPLAIYVTNNSSGSWSTPRELIGDAANSPSLKVRDGSVYLAYIQGAPSDVIDDEPSFPLMYGTDRSGSFVAEQIAENGGNPQLVLDADGRPHVLFGSPFWGQLGVGYAVGSSGAGSFSVESLPSAGDERDVSLAIDSSGTPHALWSSWAEDAARPTVLHAQRGSGGWSRPSVVVENAWGAAIGAGPGGALHGLAMGQDSGVWYIGNQGGNLAAERLSDATGQQPAIEVDGSGRPHVVFLGGESGDLPQGMWYGVGPAN